jgi:hypothetical protein
VLAQTPPTTRRPGTCSKVAEGEGPLDGTTSRAVVVPSSRPAHRRQRHLVQESPASSATLAATGREAARQAYGCHADAEAAAATRRALQSAYHWVAVAVPERSTSGPGRPRSTPPRGGKALRYGLPVTRHERAEGRARKTPEAGGCVLLPTVPTVGEMAHRAGDLLRAYKEQQGLEQHYGFLQDPLIVHRVCLQKPERMEALGLVLLLARLLWRLVERARRVPVETTGPPLPGWAKKAPQKPTAVMLMTQLAGVMVINVGGHRPLAHPLATVQQPSLVALRVPTTSFTAPPSG